MSKVVILGSKSIARLYNNKGELIAESEGVWVNGELEADLTLVQGGELENEVYQGDRRSWE